MFHFLGFLFIILIAILFTGLSIIGAVTRSVFGLGGRRSLNAHRGENGNYQSGEGYSFNDRQQSASSHEEAAHKEKTSLHSNPRKKFFSQGEGEYVEFEEIKD